MTCCSRVVAKPAKPVVVWWSCRQDLGLRFGFRVRISELVASAKSYPHSLNSFLLEKADLICHFWPLDRLSVGDSSGQIMTAMASLSGLQQLNMETRAVHPHLLTSRFRSRWSKRALRLAHP